MARCPNCKQEYGEELPGCPGCGPDRPAISPEEWWEQDDEAVFLTAVSDDIAADIAITFLAQNHIPVLKVSRGQTDHLKLSATSTLFGCDLLTPARCLSRATELLGELNAARPGDMTAEEAGEAEEEAERYRRGKRWILVLFLVLLPLALWYLRSL